MLRYQIHSPTFLIVCHSHNFYNSVMLCLFLFAIVSSLRIHTTIPNGSQDLIAQKINPPAATNEMFRNHLQLQHAEKDTRHLKKGGSLVFSMQKVRKIGEGKGVKAFDGSQTKLLAACCLLHSMKNSSRAFENKKKRFPQGVPVYKQACNSCYEQKTTFHAPVLIATLAGSSTQRK